MLLITIWYCASQVIIGVQLLFILTEFWSDFDASFLPQQFSWKFVLHLQRVIYFIQVHLNLVNFIIYRVFVFLCRDCFNSLLLC